jgi:hypothetical protein
VIGKSPPLGIIEGFYGRPYGWEEREGMVRALAPVGYELYLYAPKADELFRRQWRDPILPSQFDALKVFASCCRDHGVRFGVGLSPYELYLGFDGGAKVALATKLAQLDDIGVETLGIFFDDMRGDLPDLAARQIEICHWVGARTAASRISVCPSYYTDDPVLDRVFGQRPVEYLKDLGAGLDPAHDLMWTGPEVCSREFTPGHLARVTALLRRKPVIWDNYPVNDGPRMSPHLHLRAFTGRPGSMAASIAGHVVNMASQPVLSRIPALTLAASYAEGAAYDYGAAFARAAADVLGPDLAAAVTRRLMFLEDVGLEGFTPERRQGLQSEFAAFDHPAAREIMAWLDGAWTLTPEAAPT